MRYLWLYRANQCVISGTLGDQDVLNAAVTEYPWMFGAIPYSFFFWLGLSFDRLTRAVVGARCDCPCAKPRDPAGSRAVSYVLQNDRAHGISKNPHF